MPLLPHSYRYWMLWPFKVGQSDRWKMGFRTLFCIFLGYQHHFRCWLAIWIIFSLNCLLISFVLFFFFHVIVYLSLINLLEFFIYQLYQNLFSVTFFSVYQLSFEVNCSENCSVMSNSSPSPTVHGILQARILEWVAFPFSRASSQPRELSPGLPHCRQTLYQLSHKGSTSTVLWHYI